MQDVIVKGNHLLIAKELTRVQPLKSAALRRTVFDGKTTEDVVSKLIKDAFWKADKDDMEWFNQRKDELIKTALNLGLTELAAELTLFT